MQQTFAVIASGGDDTDNGATFAGVTRAFKNAAMLAMLRLCYAGAWYSRRSDPTLGSERWSVFLPLFIPEM